MAYQGKKVAPTTSGLSNKTPAPVQVVKSPKDTSWGRSSGGPEGNPGQNAYGGSSSLTPGKAAAPAAIDASPDPTGARAQVIASGAGRRDQVENWQTREIDKAGEHNVADSFGSASARSRQAGGTEKFSSKLPTSLADDQKDPVRKPV